MPDGPARVEAFHEFLIDAESVGAIGNIAANLVFGEMPKFQADLLARVVARAVEGRVEEAMGQHAARLDGLSASKSSPPPAAAPRGYWWAARSQETGGLEKRGGATAHFFVDGEGASACGLARLDDGSWMKLTLSQERTVTPENRERNFCRGCEEREHVDS